MKPTVLTSILAPALWTPMVAQQAGLAERFKQRFGMEQNIKSEPNADLSTTEKTIANTLKALGYRTYALGKWHLGEDLPEHHPNQRGFDEYFGFLSGARTYFQFTNPVQREQASAQRQVARD